jgi:hypothetical protein
VSFWSQKCPLLPRKQTLDDGVGMCASGQKRTQNLARYKKSPARREPGQVRWEELRNRNIALAESQGNAHAMSALSPITDIARRPWHVGFGPIADISSSIRSPRRLVQSVQAAQTGCGINLITTGKCFSAEKYKGVWTATPKKPLLR